MNAPSRLIFVAALLAGLAVGLGAWSAHGLESWLAAQELGPEWVAKRAGQFEVGVRYQMYHAIGLLALAAVAEHLSVRSLHWIGGAIVLGTILFSGSLYLLVVTDTPSLGRVTPLGGLCWMVAWGSLGVAVWRGASTKQTVAG